jgi:hypothetical protein
MISISELSAALNWAKRLHDILLQLRKADRQYETVSEHWKADSEPTKVQVIVDGSVYADLGESPPFAFEVLEDMPRAEECLYNMRQLVRIEGERDAKIAKALEPLWGKLTEVRIRGNDKVGHNFQFQFRDWRIPKRTRSAITDKAFAIAMKVLDESYETDGPMIH